MQVRTLFYCLILALLLPACQGTRHLAVQPAAAPIEFTLLQLNDVYEISPLEGGKSGGLARVASLKQQLLAENPNTIALLSGDFLSPSLIGNLKLPDGERIAGLQMVEALNAMGLDYATFGNHEFDLSSGALLQKRIHQSDFAYTVCNARRLEDGVARPFTQSIAGEVEEMPDYLVHTFANEQGQQVRVGIIGVVLPFNQADYVYYEPVTEAFRRTYEAIKDEVDLVVAMTHLNEDDDLELARAVPGVLLFMGGHDHHNMSHFVEETVITKADANAKTAYIHRVAYYPGAKVAKLRSSLQPIGEALPDEPKTAAVVQRWQEEVNAIMQEQGYEPGEQLMYTELPLECTEAVIRNRQTNFGQLTLSAFEAAWPGADAYLINSGSMRLDDNIQGYVTQYDVLRTFPFGGGIALMEMPGSVLRELMQIGTVTNRGEGGYMQYAGPDWEGEQWLLNGQPLRDEATYKVVLPQFVAAGKEANLGMLSEQPSETEAAFGIKGREVRNDVRDLVIDYMRSL